MKYYLTIILFSLYYCVKNTKVNHEDIYEIILISNNDTFNFTKNYYILDKKYKNPGIYRLNMKKNEINLIKDFIIKEKIYSLSDSLDFLKICRNMPCECKIIIIYNSGRKQIFKLDNHYYEQTLCNDSYKKIHRLEMMISEILMTKKIDPEPLNSNL